LGITLKELGRLDEAEASYKQAIALKPDYAEAHGNLGEVLLHKGHHREGLNEKLIGTGAICFDLNNGLIIL
jgi:cytochrome c-type biogenesis protein CcmH/NrfG